GAALLAAIVDEMIDSLPNMRITRTGYGAGAKDFPETPNILRVMEGEKSGNFRETVYVLETNIDDSSGEVMGYLVEKLLNEGALDVTIIPAIGKKNRPVNIVKVIAEADKHLSIANMIIRETGTLGVRVMRTERVKVSRKIKELPVRIGGREFKVRVKISRGVEDEIINIKPEFEDVKRLAAAVKLPIREVMKRISCKLMEDLL
ncbi:MAG: LarC family nickel insertion protein, partial [archaeon GB-1867-097]|nr:LarC family nickel insertion protein [Candidatus Culexmicrobium thermophilum]